jgi:hypothetical protein
MKTASLAALVLSIAVDASSLRAEVISWPLTALDLAQQRATTLNCQNNLRQIVLAARVWSLDYNRLYPADIQTFTNALPSPVVLFCPANSARQASTNWESLDWTTIDYEWVPQPNWDNPGATSCRCRIHRHVASADGSVEGQEFGYRSGWPTIIAGPLGQEAVPGSEVRFDVGIAPDALLPIRYQWRREQLSFVTNVTFVADPDEVNGGHWTTNRRGTFSSTLLTGQTNSSYVISQAQPTHSDYYSVMVSNVLGATVSRPSRLWVDPSVGAKVADNYWSALHCVNNLKQIALFGQILASDHNELLPQSLAAMTNSYGLPLFGWPVLLYCRFDTARTVPVDWAAVDFANTSYEILPVQSPVDENPSAPFCRCKAHGFYAQADGQVIYRPRFNSIRSLANNTLELSVTVFAGQTNLLEVSTNLATWATLSTGPSTHGTFLLYQTNQSAQQFYRVRTE